MIKLYHFEGSPFGWMARMGLAEKGLQYEKVEPRDRDKNPELRNLNPINRTPTLVDDGTVVFESFALLEYLDEKYPNPPLMPSAPADRARARAMALMGYLYIYPEGRTIGLQLFDWEHWDPAKAMYPARRPADQVDRKIVDEAEKRLLGHIQILENELSQRPYQTGPMFGIADIVLVPAVAGFRLRGGPMQGFPNLSDWYERCMARPSVKETATPVVKRGEPI